MMNTMTYREYKARIEFDARDNIFVGRVLGIADSITFHGDRVAELTRRFIMPSNITFRTARKPSACRKSPPPAG